MRKEPFIIVLVKWICWSFVFGVGTANVIGLQEPGLILKMWVLCGMFFVLAVYFYFVSRDLLKYMLVPCFIVLGIASYHWRFDTFHPDHIKNLKDIGKWEKTLVRGVIVRDPDVRDWITHVILKPEEVVESPIRSKVTRKLSGKTGYVILFVSRMINDENPYYDRMEFGDRIQVTGFLSDPVLLSNPYGFNYARNLMNKNIYASMYIGSAENIKFMEKSTTGIFGRIKKFAYKLKDRMILGIKKTIPPPHSAFVGGVTVGARGGVPEAMKYDFQATGVAHVLALSGLHVGFLAFMLIMVFNNIFKSQLLFYRFPSRLMGKEIDLTPYSLKLIPVFVVTVLFMFVIITGARPATVRAAMMYSIAIVFYYLLGMNIWRAGSITIPMSAAIMLVFNPSIIFDASFALSFTAVWSIIYLSGPLRQIFTRVLVGWGQVVFFLLIISAIMLLVVSPRLFSNSGFNGFYLFVFAGLAAGAYFLEKRHPLTGFGFEGWWPYISGFFCVQLSIQIGMMWPLSGVYFNRFPIAGMLANFIAIPLIGIIVPLGLIGELFTLIPGAGEHIGLAIGATNTLFSGFFLWMAKFFRTYFPYPVQSIPPARWLVIYYLIVMVFAFNKGIREFFISRFKISKKIANWSLTGLMVFVFSSGYWGKEIVKGSVKEKNELLVTFLDVGYGNCVLIQTPGGKSILIDGGIRGDKRYWSMGKWGKGTSVLIPNLAGYNISKLDKLVLSCPLPENVGGLIYVLEHFNVKEVWDTLDPSVFRHDMSYQEFLDRINDVSLDVRREKSLSIGIYLNYYDFLNAGVSGADETYKSNKIFGKKSIPRYWLKKGIVLHRENIKGKVLELKVLNPPEERMSGTESDFFNNSAVLKLTYGKRSFLFPSNILAEGESALVDEFDDGLRADVLLIPNHGSTAASSAAFLDKVRPSFAVVQYGYLRDRSFREMELRMTLKEYKNRGVKTYRMDKSGAVEVRTDGSRISLRTVLGKKK